MKRTTLFLQVTAGILLIGLLALVVATRFLTADDPRNDRDPTEPIPPAAAAPDRRDRVFHAHVEDCLLVLAPLYRLENRSAFEGQWLERVFGPGAAETTHLFLHLIQEGGPRPFRFDPAADRVELVLSDGARITSAALGREIRDRPLNAADRLYLRSILPEAPIALGPCAMARVLLGFSTPEAWSRIAEVRFRSGETSTPLIPVELGFAEWEVLLSGGPLPKAIRPPRREAALPSQRSR